jgi:hypothetical protein
MTAELAPIVIVQEAPVQTVVINKDPTTIVEINHLGLQGPRGAGPEFIHEPRSLTLTEATNNKLYLNRLADKNSLILLQISGAPMQVRDVDYGFIEGENAISWAGFGLENFLEENELIEIIYLPKN